MSTVSLQVPEREAGILRIFRLDIESDAGSELRNAVASAEADATRPAAAALGLDDIDPWWVTVVTMSEIAELGLSSFLSQGYDVPEAQLSEAAETLREAEGTLLIVQSPAFKRRAVTLAPADYLAPLAQFDMAGSPAPAEAMPRAETGTLDRAPPAPEREYTQGRGALRPAVLLGLLLIAGLLVALAVL